MLRIAAFLLLLSLPALADYVVLVGVDKNDLYDRAARLLAKHHRTQHVLRFDPERPEAIAKKLRRIQPTQVAIVLRPEQIHVNSVRRILKMSTTIDDDPFVDFEFGYITGETAAEAVRFVENIIRASKRKPLVKVGKASVWGGKYESLASDGTYEAGDLSFPMRSLRFVAPNGKHGRNQEFIDKNLRSLEGCGAIIMGGHGMPWEIGSGPRAEDMAKLELFPAVAFNYACHTGVTRTYPERKYESGVYVQRLFEIDAKRSFALSMIRAGITGYVAYVNPRPAGPELSIDFQRVLAGSTLGAARRNDYNKITLGYLGYGEKGIVPPAWQEGLRQPAREVDAVRHMMLDGATGGILYGDPAFRPFPEAKPNSLPLKVQTKTVEGALHVTMRVMAYWAYVWCAEPFRRFDEKSRTMAMKVYTRVEVPETWTDVGSVRIASATWAGNPVTTLEPVWAVENDQGKRYLHLKANFERTSKHRGDIVVTMVASEKGAKPEPAAAPRPDVSKKETCLDYARQVGEHLVARDGKLEKGDVYSGTAGVALFYFDLYAATKEERWLEAGSALLDRSTASDPGLYTGWAGIGEVALQAWHITKDDAFLKKAESCADKLGEPEATDIISGAAGTGIFLLNLRKATNDERYLKKARALGEYLAQHAVQKRDGMVSWPVAPGSGRTYIGFSHGAAGIGYYLLHLHLATKEERYKDLAQGAAWFVMRYAEEDGADGWKWTKLQPPQNQAYPVQWCHGSPGIGLFFHAINRHLGGNEYKEALDRCLAANAREGRTARRSGCQCHGLSGNAELFVEVGQPEKARLWAQDLVGPDGVKTGIGRWTYEPGYMTGLAGIGRFFLRLADPESTELAFMVR